MFKEDILIARSNSKILLFKFTKNKEGIYEWLQYAQIKSRGFVSGTRSSRNFQIIEDELIHFYNLDDNNMPII
jgi:hypothetical protein